MVSIDNTEIVAGTIDGSEITEITVDGDVVWQANVGANNGVARFEFEQNLNDSWGNHSAGVDNTSAGYVTNSKVGSYSKVFDGENDYIRWDNELDRFFDGSSDATFSVWVYPRQTHNTDNYNLIFSGRNHSNINLYEDKGNWEVSYVADGRVAYSIQGNAIQTNTWTFLTFIFESGGDLILYENGTEVDRVTHNSTTPNVRNQPVMTSRKPWDSTEGFFDGYIDDMRIYDYARPQSQIVDYYNTFV